jgi:hypothetical protein
MRAVGVLPPPSASINQKPLRRLCCVLQNELLQRVQAAHDLGRTLRILTIGTRLVAVSMLSRSSRPTYTPGAGASYSLMKG